MAEAFVTAAEDELSCPICLELFVEPNVPKDLPGCDHVVCEVCLKKIEKTVIGRRRVINCPECRKDTDLPKGGVEALRTNRKVRNLAEKHPRDKLVKDTTTNITKDVQTVRKEDLESILNEKRSRIDQGKKVLQELKNVHDLVQQAQDAEELKVTECAEEYINIVHARMQSLHAELKKAGQEKKLKLEDKINELDAQIQNAEESFRHVSDRTLKILTSDQSEDGKEDVTDVNSLHDILKTISVDIPRVSFSDRAPATFRKDVTQPEINLGRLIYEVHAVTPEVKSKITRGATPNMTTGPISLKLKQILDDFNSTRIAWSPKNWLVISVGRKRLIVLCQKQHDMFKPERTWQVECSFQPGGVAVSGDGTQIFVALWTDVWVYSPVGKFLRKFRGTQNGVHSIKVTTTDRILVGYYHGNVITEHNPRGDVIRTVKTSIKPYFMTLIRAQGNTHIAMSDFEKGKVTVIRSVINPHTPVQQTLNISIPEVRGICYDEAANSLLAITRNGACVDQFCAATGRFVSRVLEGLNSAWDLSISAEKILAVSTGEGIKLYQVV